MPELPEVQTTVNGLNRAVRGLKITGVWTDYNSAFHKGKDSIKDPAYFRYFKKNVTGAKIVSADRVAKNILINIEKTTGGKGDAQKFAILVHMKMTGHLMYGDYDRTDPFNRFIHLIFTFDNGKTLELSDMRKFAKVTLIAEKDIGKGADQEKSAGQSPHLANIGPDPLDKSFTFSVFKERLARKSTGRIKTALMDQSIIAGIGNIYSDEALWRAGIHPEERVKNIFGRNNSARNDSDALLKKLYMAIITVLKKGINFGGDSMSDYRNIHGKRGRFQEQHHAYRKTGERCELMIRGPHGGKAKRCKGVIMRKVVGGRSAHFCSVHQKLSKKF
jgi:formamidopyrimidine-DNA glycosylase